MKLLTTTLAALAVATPLLADSFDPSKAPQSWLNTQAEERCESKGDTFDGRNAKIIDDWFGFSCVDSKGNHSFFAHQPLPTPDQGDDDNGGDPSER